MSFVFGPKQMAEIDVGGERAFESPVDETPTRLDPASPEGHVVVFFDTEAFLVENVRDFLAPWVSGGDIAIVVATAPHRRAFATALDAARVDVSAAAAEGRYLAFDAQELLSRFMADGGPDPVRFRDAVVGMLDAATHGGRRLRVYGEMVAVLWEEGTVEQALAVEILWNELAAQREFELLCAYPMRAFRDPATAGPFRQICRQHGTVVPCEGYSLLDASQRARAVAVLQQEAAAREPEMLRLRAQHQALTQLAYGDPITGLRNRRAFDEDLRREWALTRRHAGDTFVVVADLDGFKQVNDGFGHAAGDQALREFADTLRAVVRSTDIVARIGGDEFAVLLVQCDARAVRRFEARVNETLAAHSRARHVPLSVSLGHASLVAASSPTIALDRADIAMLTQKGTRRS